MSASLRPFRFLQVNYYDSEFRTIRAYVVTAASTTFLSSKDWMELSAVSFGKV